MRSLRKDNKGSAYHWVLFMALIFALVMLTLVLGMFFKYFNPIAEDMIGHMPIYDKFETFIEMGRFYPVVGVFAGLLGVFLGIVLRESVRR